MKPFSEIPRHKNPVHAHLMATVSHLDVPQPPDHAEVRVEIARRLLGRMPVIMRHPWDGSVVFVESEPDDWREFLEERMRDGALGEVLKDAALAGRVV